MSDPLAHRHLLKRRSARILCLPRVKKALDAGGAQCAADVLGIDRPPA